MSQEYLRLKKLILTYTEDGNVSVNDTVKNLSDWMRIITTEGTQLQHQLEEDVGFMLPRLLLMAASNRASLIRAVLPPLNALVHVVKSKPQPATQARPPWWTLLETKTIPMFCGKLSKILDSQDVSWAEPWCFAVSLMCSETYISGPSINELLKVVEKAFKISKRKEKMLPLVFQCWRHLVDAFFTQGHTCFHTKKVYGLVITPLLSPMPQSSTPHKLKTWRHIVEKIEGCSEAAIEAVVTPLLDNMYSECKEDDRPTPGSQKKRVKLSSSQPNECCSLLSLVANFDGVFGSPCGHRIVSLLTECLAPGVRDATYQRLWTVVLDKLKAINCLGEEECQIFVVLKRTFEAAGRSEMGLQLLEKAAESGMFRFHRISTLLYNGTSTDVGLLFADLLPIGVFWKCAFEPLLVELNEIKIEAGDKTFQDKATLVWNMATHAFILWSGNHHAAQQTKNRSTSQTSASQRLPVLQLQIDNTVFALLKWPLKMVPQKWCGKVHHKWCSVIDSWWRISGSTCSSEDSLLSRHLTEVVTPGFVSNSIHPAVIVDVCSQTFSVDKSCVKVALSILDMVVRKPPPKDAKLVMDLLLVVEKAISVIPNSSSLSKQDVAPILAELFKFSTTFEQPHEHRIWTKVTKLQRKLMAIKKDEPSPSNNDKGQPNVKCSLMVQSNFLHRLGKAEKVKHALKHSDLAVMFGPAEAASSAPRQSKSPMNGVLQAPLNDTQTTLKLQKDVVGKKTNYEVISIDEEQDEVVVLNSFKCQTSNKAKECSEEVKGSVNSFEKNVLKGEVSSSKPKEIAEVKSSNKLNTVEALGTSQCSPLKSDMMKLCVKLSPLSKSSLQRCLNGSTKNDSPERDSLITSTTEADNFECTKTPASTSSQSVQHITKKSLTEVEEPNENQLCKTRVEERNLQEDSSPIRKNTDREASNSSKLSSVPMKVPVSPKSIQCRPEVEKPDPSENSNRDMSKESRVPSDGKVVKCPSSPNVTTHSTSSLAKLREGHILSEAAESSGNRETVDKVSKSSTLTVPITRASQRKLEVGKQNESFPDVNSTTPEKKDADSGVKKNLKQKSLQHKSQALGKANNMEISDDTEATKVERTTPVTRRKSMGTSPNEVTSSNNSLEIVIKIPSTTSKSVETKSPTTVTMTRGTYRRATRRHPEEGSDLEASSEQPHVKVKDGSKSLEESVKDSKDEDFKTMPTLPESTCISKLSQEFKEKTRNLTKTDKDSIVPIKCSGKSNISVVFESSQADTELPSKPERSNDGSKTLSRISEPVTKNTSNVQPSGAEASKDSNSTDPTPGSADALESQVQSDILKWGFPPETSQTVSEPKPQLAKTLTHTVVRIVIEPSNFDTQLKSFQTDPPLKTELPPKSIIKSTATPYSSTKRKSFPIMFEDSEDFVVIPPKPKTPTPMTEHQKEVMRERRSAGDIPALYQDLSQQGSQTFDSCESTQVSTFVQHEFNCEEQSMKPFSVDKKLQEGADSGKGMKLNKEDSEIRKTPTSEVVVRRSVRHSISKYHSVDQRNTGKNNQKPKAVEKSLSPENVVELANGSINGIVKRMEVENNLNESNRSLENDEGSIETVVKKPTGVRRVLKEEARTINFSPKFLRSRSRLSSGAEEVKKAKGGKEKETLPSKACIKKSGKKTIEAKKSTPTAEVRAEKNTGEVKRVAAEEVGELSGKNGSRIREVEESEEKSGSGMKRIEPEMEKTADNNMRLVEKEKTKGVSLTELEEAKRILDILEDDGKVLEVDQSEVRNLEKNERTVVHEMDKVGKIGYKEQGEVAEKVENIKDSENKLDARENKEEGARKSLEKVDTKAADGTNNLSDMKVNEVEKNVEKNLDEVPKNEAEIEKMKADTQKTDGKNKMKEDGQTDVSKKSEDMMINGEGDNGEEAKGEVKKTKEAVKTLKLVQKVVDWLKEGDVCPLPPEDAASDSILLGENTGNLVQNSVEESRGSKRKFNLVDSDDTNSLNDAKKRPCESFRIETKPLGSNRPASNLDQWLTRTKKLSMEETQEKVPASLESDVLNGQVASAGSICDDSDEIIASSQEGTPSSATSVAVNWSPSTSTPIVNKQTPQDGDSGSPVSSLEGSPRMLKTRRKGTPHPTKIFPATSRSSPIASGSGRRSAKMIRLAANLVPLPATERDSPNDSDRSPNAANSASKVALRMKNFTPRLKRGRPRKLFQAVIPFQPSWPSGECEDWVACAPTPPETTPTSGILKRRMDQEALEMNLVAAVQVETKGVEARTTGEPSRVHQPAPCTPSPPSNKKKRVSFLDPPVSKGLLYHTDGCEGQVQHANVSPNKRRGSPYVFRCALSSSATTEGRTSDSFLSNINEEECQENMVKQEKLDEDETNDEVMEIQDSDNSGISFKSRGNLTHLDDPMERSENVSTQKGSASASPVRQEHPAKEEGGNKSSRECDKIEEKRGAKDKGEEAKTDSTACALGGESGGKSVVEKNCMAESPRKKGSVVGQANGTTISTTVIDDDLVMTEVVMDPKTVENIIVGRQSPVEKKKNEDMKTTTLEDETQSVTITNATLLPVTSSSCDVGSKDDIGNKETAAQTETRWSALTEEYIRDPRFVEELAQIVNLDFVARLCSLMATCQSKQPGGSEN